MAVPAGLLRIEELMVTKSKHVPAKMTPFAKPRRATNHSDMYDMHGGYSNDPPTAYNTPCNPTKVET